MDISSPSFLPSYRNALFGRDKKTVSVWGITVLPPVFKNTPVSSTERDKNRGADDSKKEKNSFSVFSTLGFPDGRLFHQSGSRTRKFSLSLPPAGRHAQCEGNLRVSENLGLR